MSGKRCTEVTFKVLINKYLSSVKCTCVFGGKDEFVARGAPRNVGFGGVVPCAVDLPGLVVVKQVGQQALDRKICIIRRLIWVIGYVQKMMKLCTC